MKRHVASCDCGWTSNPTRSQAQADYALRTHSCEKQQARDEGKARRLAREANVDRTPKDCNHKRTTHTHGTHACYVLDRCRCRPCADANSDYERTRSRRHAYGRFGNDWVDAQPAREHIADLMSQGMGLKRIVELADYSQGAMTRLMYGTRDRGPSKRIRAHAAQSLLAVRVSIDTLAGGARIDNTGTVRRLQALMVNGWSQTKLAHAIGLEVRNFNHLVHGQRAVTVNTARKVRELYEQLWDQTPPLTSQGHRGAYTRAKRYAEERGWVPPLAWDDDTIDDPNAMPASDLPDGTDVDELAIERALAGDHVPLTDAERLEVLTRLVTDGLSDAAIARRMHVTDRTVLRWRQTHNLESRWAA